MNGKKPKRLGAAEPTSPESPKHLFPRLAPMLLSFALPVHRRPGLSEHVDHAYLGQLRQPTTVRDIPTGLLVEGGLVSEKQRKRRLFNFFVRISARTTN